MRNRERMEGAVGFRVMGKRDKNTMRWDKGLGLRV